MSLTSCPIFWDHLTITKNTRTDTPDTLRDDPRLARLVSCLSSHGMTEDAARAIVRDHDTELVEWATTDLARRLKGKEKIDNPAGWLHNAIEEDWRPQPTLPRSKPRPAKTSVWPNGNAWIRR